MPAGPPQSPLTKPARSSSGSGRPWRLWQKTAVLALAVFVVLWSGYSLAQSLGWLPRPDQAPQQTQLAHEPEAAPTDPTLPHPLRDPLFPPALAPTPQVLPQFLDLLAQNDQTIGWIRIPGTHIDYPVVQGPYSDWDFYLNRSFTRQHDGHGTPYIWPHNNILKDDLTFIFAHNMRDGSRFADIARYRNESFCTAHPIIEFDTLYVEARFAVAAVFMVHSQTGVADYFQHPTRGIADQTPFPYVFTTRWANQEEFDQFRDLVREYQLFDTGVDFSREDRLIALWTCAGAGVAEERVIVIAKELPTTD
ncbi:MAG: sortase [Coriobacteriia bacterium]|nr:sortase [Coriobacteriia bacterium]